MKAINNLRHVNAIIVEVKHLSCDIGGGAGGGGGGDYCNVIKRRENI